ncbi:MAG: 2-dehydro-3-deoxy-6-phosphogalactonate aldolase [Bdellovibrionota bacterium]
MRTSNPFSLIAILRGIKPEMVIPVAEVLIAHGFKAIEVPTNSPRVFESIENLCKNIDLSIRIGAGTVLTPQQVVDAKNAGASFIVSPNTNAEVIRKAVEMDLDTFPGVYTITEAFEAIQAGSNRLKLFPANALTPTIIKDWKSVLPLQTEIYAVGGVDATNLSTWMQAGAAGVGLGSCLYKTEYLLDEIAARAFEITQAQKVNHSQT